MLPLFCSFDSLGVGRSPSEHSRLIRFKNRAGLRKDIASMQESAYRLSKEGVGFVCESSERDELHAVRAPPQHAGRGETSREWSG